MRSVSQIYSEAVSVRNNYLQLTELNSGRSNSKLSMINLLTYVVAVCIHTYEAVLDVFQLKMTEALSGRINGTPDWYALTAKKFQYNSSSEIGDALIFNENTLKVEYETVNPANRIIDKAAWQTGEDGQSILLKVCKANTNSNELNNGIPYTQLTDNEMKAFKMFIQQIKFVGANIESVSYPGDIITVVADNDNPIFYNENYATSAQVLSSIQQSLIDFANEFEYNGFLYYQTLMNTIRKAEHVVDTSNGIKIYISSYNKETGVYDEPVELKNRVRLKSGYIRLLDTNSAMTVNSKNITLLPSSEMDKYSTVL